MMDALDVVLGTGVPFVARVVLAVGTWVLLWAVIGRMRYARLWWRNRDSSLVAERRERARRRVTVVGRGWLVVWVVSALLNEGMGLGASGDPSSYWDNMVTWVGLSGLMVLAGMTLLSAAVWVIGYLAVDMWDEMARRGFVQARPSGDQTETVAGRARRRERSR